MSSLKIISKLLPLDINREAPRAKRRKLSCNAHSNEPQQQHSRQNISHGTSHNPPSVLVNDALANRGFPNRLDPLSIEYLMDFDYESGNHHSRISSEILEAIRNENVKWLQQYLGSQERLFVHRDSQGETLLHLACRSGSVSVVDFLLRDDHASTLVLDKQGRSPLHGICVAMQSNGMIQCTNSNHFECMRLLLREKPTLVLFKDKNGKVPLEYLSPQASVTFYTRHAGTLELWKSVNELICAERVVEKVIEELTHRMEGLRSGRRPSVFDTINSMLDLSGLQSAIMETGLSI